MFISTQPLKKIFFRARTGRKVPLVFNHSSPGTRCSQTKQRGVCFFCQCDVAYNYANVTSTKKTNTAFLGGLCLNLLVSAETHSGKRGFSSGAILPNSLSGTAQPTLFTNIFKIQRAKFSVIPATCHGTIL